MGALPVEMYTEAIKEGWLSSFLGLPVKSVHKHFPKSAQTVMGHLHMIRKGIRPTPGDKTIKINEWMNEVMKPDYDEIIRNELSLNRKHKVGVSVFKFDELNGIISTDLPEWFRTTLTRGHAYILVMYCYTNNTILATAIESRRAKHIEKWYYELYKKDLLSEIIPVLQRIDNETSKISRLMKRTSRTKSPLQVIIVFCRWNVLYKRFKPLHFNLIWCWLNFPCISMGLSPPTNSNDIKYGQKIKDKSTPIGLSTYMG